MSEHLSVRVSAQVKEQLEVLAQKLGLSVSELIRSIADIIATVSKAQEEKEAKIQLITNVLEILERLARESKDVEIHIASLDRQDYPGQVPYYFTFECYNGVCKTTMKQGDMEWSASLRDLAKALLEDYYWDIRNVLNALKMAIY